MFKRYWWMLLAMAPVGILVGFLLASVATYVMPKEYESFATIEIRPHRSTTSSGSPIMTPVYIGTELNKITSRNSLMNVSEKLDLANKWDMDQETVLRILKTIVKTENIRGTDLIAITVRYNNREDARDITAEVARAYKEYRSDLESKTLDLGILELKKTVREQEDKVEEMRNSVMNRSLLHSSNTPDSEKEYLDTKGDFETDQALLEQMKLRLVAAEIERDIEPDYIVIHDDPVIADSPVSPNVTLNLVLGAVGGLLISPFLALPLMWWLQRRNPAQG